MLTRLQEGAKYRIPLFRMLQANTLEMTMQNLLRFPDHLARDSGLIVNTFL
jgi:hypothetical protein